MTDKAQIRGDDASNHAPQPKKSDEDTSAKNKQDAPNYNDKAKGRGAINVEDVSSGNDEGAD